MKNLGTDINKVYKLQQQGFSFFGLSSVIQIHDICHFLRQQFPLGFGQNNVIQNPCNGSQNTMDEVAKRQFNNVGGQAGEGSVGKNFYEDLFLVVTTSNLRSNQSGTAGHGVTRHRRKDLRCMNGCHHVC